MSATWSEVKEATNVLLNATVYAHRNPKPVDPVSAFHNNNLPGAMRSVLVHVAVYGSPVANQAQLDIIVEGHKKLDKVGHL